MIQEAFVTLFFICVAAFLVGLVMVLAKKPGGGTLALIGFVLTVLLFFFLGYQ